MSAMLINTCQLCSVTVQKLFNVVKNHSSSNNDNDVCSLASALFMSPSTSTVSS